MILLTGATGTVGSGAAAAAARARRRRPLPGARPAAAGAQRVDVQIALGDLGELRDPYLARQALRGVDTVVHLAATIRDQPRAGSRS